MAEQRKMAFVCGHPIAHSRSPKIHGHWLDELGIAGSYEAIDVEPDRFSEFLMRAGERGYVGGNVTIPHKEAAFRLVERRDEAAEAIGAVNTVWIEDGKLVGSNTDGHGFAANLDQRSPGWDKGGVAVVLGAGGAARAVLHVLKQRGFSEIRVVNRSVDRAEDLARTFGDPVTAHDLRDADKLLGDAALLVNTTSLGMKGQGDFPVDLGLLPETALVTDLVYVPLETPLLAAAKKRGLRAIDGLGMLLHQAAPGFERWFGKRPQVTDALRAKIVADIERS